MLTIYFSKILAKKTTPKYIYTNQIKCKELRGVAKVVQNLNLSCVDSYIWSICSKLWVFSPQNQGIKHAEYSPFHDSYNSYNR